MKDYRLSEVQAICVKRKRINAGCIGCEMEEFCFALSPACVDIEPRDMIELPCKEHFTYTHHNGHITENWRVYYRSEFDLIETAIFPTEAEADAFLEKLRGGKR